MSSSKRSRRTIPRTRCAGRVEDTEFHLRFAALMYLATKARPGRRSHDGDPDGDEPDLRFLLLARGCLALPLRELRHYRHLHAHRWADDGISLGECR